MCPYMAYIFCSKMTLNPKQLISLHIVNVFLCVLGKHRETCEEQSKRRLNSVGELPGEKERKEQNEKRKEKGERFSFIYVI